MHQALYRKWRPKTFEDVSGQDHITSVLKSEVSSGKLTHAYIFCGPRGTGKTTCAKIISKAVNCEHPVNGNPCGKCPSCIAIEEGRTTDVIEMDAASNNGVDNVRDIRDGVAYTPADLKYKVYIIDEVHMLSVAAFNALLKTLEEPPEYVIFILATTEINKIPATVLSRCQRFDFHRVSEEVIAKRLRTVCDGEGIDSEDAALYLIAGLAQGAFRDALNMLEYCSGVGGKITEKSAGELLGASSSELLCGMAVAIAEKNVSLSLENIADISATSRDIAVFWHELIGFFRNVLIYSSTRGNMKNDKYTSRAAEKFTVPSIMRVLEIMCSAEENMTRTPSSARLFAEMAIVRMCDETLDTDISAILNRVSSLEEKLKSVISGNIAVKTFSKSEDDVSDPDVNVPVKDTTVSVPETKKEVSSSSKTSSLISDNKENADTSAKEEKSGATRSVGLRGFADVIKRLEATDPSIASFMVGSTAVDKGGKLYIYLDSDFAANFVSAPERKTVLSTLIFDVLQKRYDINSIFPVCSENETEEYDAIDELL